MRTAEEVMVKGSSVRSLQKFLDSELTSAEKDHLFASLPKEYADRLRLPVMATETIPYMMVNRLTEEAAKIKHQLVDEFARRAGREGAKDAITGVYRFFARVMTPAGLLSKAAPLWTTIYDAGSMHVEKQSDEEAVLRVMDFPAHPAGCSRLSGWMEQVALMTGATTPHVTHSKCLSKGAPYCEWQMRWK